MTMGQIVLVRHGETRWSLAGRHTGLTDLPLTADGEAQARSLRPSLSTHPFALVLTSPRLRARRTAELAGVGDAEVDEDLAEWAYGDYEGLTTPEIRERVPGWSIWSQGCPGGESPDEVATRLDRVVARALASHGPVLAFAHGHSLRALGGRWLELPLPKANIFYLDTATISVLGHDRETPVVRRWNS